MAEQCQGGAVCERHGGHFPTAKERFLDASGGLAITASGQYSSDELCNLLQDLISCAQTSGHPFDLCFEMREVREMQKTCEIREAVS